jgi:endonuclease/exonuclease/phosphatase family metal-dependent hydrolase
MRKGIILTLAVLATAILVCGEEALAKEKDKKTVTVANINIFHGIPCVAAGDETQCRLDERIDLLFKHLVATDCPDIVTLQEIVTREIVRITDTGDCVGPLDDTVALIEERLPSLAKACGFTYGVVFDPAARRQGSPTCEPGRGIDEELILTRYDVLAWEVMPLYSPLDPFFFRHVLHAQIDHPVGFLDVFTTHLASESDLASSQCGISALPSPLISPPCPDECRESVDTVQECQAKQVTAFVEAQHAGPEPALITGDLNAKPHSATYKEFAKADHRRKHRWIDSHLAADNPECNRHTGIGCTAGRDAVGEELEKPARNVNERIDYIFVVPSAPELECKIQEKGTGLFADKPNPFLRKHKHCGPFPDPICWASDHNGNRVNLSCERSTHHDFSLVSW